MKKTPLPQEWMQEFQEFLSIDEITPPRQLTERIFARVHADLNPSAWLVFSKLTLIHAFIGTLTLLFCPQFGFSPLVEMGLMNVFMQFGEQVCMLGCGAVFLSGSTLTASLLLRPEEVQVIRKTKLLQLSALALLSLGVFVCVGLSVIAGFMTFWLLGSILGGLTTLELGWAFRKWLMTR